MAAIKFWMFVRVPSTNTYMLLRTYGDSDPAKKTSWDLSDALIDVVEQDNSYMLLTKTGHRFNCDKSAVGVDGTLASAYARVHELYDAVPISAREVVSEFMRNRE